MPVFVQWNEKNGHIVKYLWSGGQELVNQNSVVALVYFKVYCCLIYMKTSFIFIIPFIRLKNKYSCPEEWFCLVIFLKQFCTYKLLS